MRRDVRLTLLMIPVCALVAALIGMFHLLTQ